MGSQQLDFYFDFMSPFAYLAHHKLPELAGRYGYALVYHPIDLPAAKLAAGNTGPPNVKVPVKIRYLRTDLDRWAQRYGVPLNFPASLDSGRLNRGYFYADDAGQAREYVDIAWRRVWGEGGDPADTVLQAEVARALAWDADAFVEFVGSDAAAARYAESNQSAQARGIFGAPIMTIGEAMWWGNDRLDFLEQHMRTASTRQPNA